MLTLICAHRAEAVPFSGGGELSPLPDSPNRLQGENFRVIITGQGPLQCRETLSRNGADWLPGPDDLWLNFGVAGHGASRSAKTWSDNTGHGGEYYSGQLVLADRIEQGNRCWRPGEVGFNRDLAAGCDLTPGGLVRTVAVPETGFSDAVLYDMEAAEIAEFLERAGSLSRLIVIKLVADGPGLSPSEQRQYAGEVLRASSQRIAMLGGKLRSL